MAGSGRSRPGSHLPFSTQRAYDTGKWNSPPLFPVQFRRERCRIPVNVTNQRFHDATGTGPLNGPNGTQPKGRRSYTASWFDPIGRTIAFADYGTNGGAALIRPESVPERSDIVLVSSQRYAAN